MAFQIGSDLLDACVLGVLSRGDAYGYSLTQSLREAITISDSTTYPVLRRLQHSGYLKTYDKPFQGRNRRYYAITPAGLEKHKENIQMWNQYKKQVDRLINGGDEID